MGLQQLKTALSTAEYAPHTLALGPELDLEPALSAPARDFIATVWPQGLGDLLDAEPLSPEVMDFYRSLEPDDRMEVLAYAGFDNHELVHRLDFLTTPFGVAFHGRACLETIGLLLESAELVAELERTDAEMPLRDIPPLADQLVVSGGVETLYARVRWFDSVRGAAPKHVQPGWMGTPGSLPLAGRELDLVTIHELLPTVSIPDAGGAYLKPLTILETRAVAHTALFLLTRLGGDDAAAADIALFLETFYTPRDAFPDYRFLLDLFAELQGGENFVDLVEKRGVGGLVVALKVMSIVCWYALHAPPESRPEGQANASPMLRLVIALNALVAYLQQGNTTIDAVKFLDGVDVDQRDAGFGIRGSRETLGHSVLYLSKVRRHNREVNPHPALRDHFESVLSVQQSLLEARHELGYDFPTGMSENGSAIAGLSVDEIDPRLLFGGEGPPESVRQWFRLREMLLFRYARPPGFWEELWAAIGAFPEAGSLPAIPPQQLALERARFVADGAWATEGEVRAAVDGPVTLIPLHTAALPATFARSEAGEDDTVETSWEAFVPSEDRLLALKVKFAGAGEEIRLLFSLERHREMLETIALSETVHLLSYAAFSILNQGEEEADSIVVHIEGAREMLGKLLRKPPARELKRCSEGWLATLSRDGAEILKLSVEAYAWPNLSAVADAFEAIARAEAEEGVLTFDVMNHPDDGEPRVLAAVGTADAFEPFRRNFIAGSGATPHPLSEAQAEYLLDDFEGKLAKAAADSGSPAALQPLDLKPLQVRLD
ncbi:MAG TPA: hypothetical protein VF093_09670 [Solirubrobacterales bacterium]